MNTTRNINVEQLVNKNKKAKAINQAIAMIEEAARKEAMMKEFFLLGQDC